MNILKRQLALLLVFAMTLTMLPMPAHADEVTEPESPSAIVEESTEKPQAPNEEISADTANKPVEKAESDTAVKENTVSAAAEAPVNTSVDSNTTTTEELIADVSKAVIDTDDTTEDAEIEENTESDPTVDSVEDSIVVDIEESEDEEDSEDNIQEETDQVESETDVLVASTFSFSRSVANAVADECEHPETEVAWDTKDQVINCKPISDTQHQISGYQYRYCTSCYERVGESFAVTEVGNHELDANGRCGMCGYNSNSGSGSGSDSDPNPDCDHANTAIGWDPDQLGPWYAQFSDTQHKVTGYRYTYCTDCGERIRDEAGGNNNYYSEELDDHSLNASGACTLCGYGYEPPCNHLRDPDSGEVSYTDPPRYEQCNEETHYIYRPTYYSCIYCGDPMEEPGYTISNEPHVPENGVCIHCGLNVGDEYCAHSEKDVAWDTNQTITYNKYNDTHHKVTGYQYTYCTSCFERVGESFATEEYEEHSLNTSGKCSLCGYQSSENTGCAHNNTEVKFYYNNPVRYAQFDEDEHYIYRAGTIYCNDCRTDIGSSNTEQWSFEAHTINDDGNCIYCGYGLGEGYCTHPNSNLVLDTDQPKTYYKKDENQHLVNFYQYHYCPDCNSRISESFMDAAWENHDFDASGVCTLCGDSACDHSSWASAWDTTQTITYTKYTAAYHKKSGYQYSYCTNCLERGGESFAYEINEAHTFDASGVCTLCGYDPNDGSGCNHENVVGTISSLDPPRYARCNETQHLVYHTMYDWCLDCNQVISEGFETASLENHVLNEDGKCTYCGYGFGEDYCTHPDTDVMWSNAPMNYTSLDKDQHQVEGCQYHYCTSCGKRISADFEIVEYEDHTFDSTGDCTLCNYRVGCEHKQTTMKLYDTLYESLNKDSHEVTRLYSKVCADPDCGKVLVSVETSYTETDIEDHDFTGNTCLLCNYTVADQLSATVTASVLTANKGDNISATVSVVGGTGGYRFSWKILKDGSVVVENPITTSASCGTNAYEEGSYVFQVTVTDSGGNTVTAQSGAITVSHGCQYETVSNTVLVNQSLTHHTVETTTYEECTICHEKRNEVTDVEWVEHTPIDAESYGHEAAHPHKKYFICECGAHPYLDGEYHTANGKVQDESVCCICHDHQYGAEEETPEGTRQKTCTNCGITTVTHTHDYKLVETTRLVIQSETHHTVETTTYEECTSCHEKRNEATNKEWVEHTPMNKDAYGYEASHDNYHQKYFICECGAHPYIDGEYETANGKVQEKSVCCICNGHKYGEAQETADGTWKKTCANCGLSQKVAAPVQPTEPEEEEEKHVHSYHDIEYIDGTAHPHKYVLKCSCGHEETGEGSYMLCCQCVGHSMGDAIRLPDGSFKEFCSRCNASQLTTPSRGVQNYYDVIDIIINRKDTAAALKEMETGNFALWKEVAVEAADELTGWGFVLTNELVHNFSENASVVGAAKAINEQYLNPETWDDQIETLWIDLLIQLLQDQEHNQEDDYIEGGLKGAEMVHFNTSAVWKVYSNSVMEEGKEFRALKARLAELTDDIDIINESIDKYTEAAETAGDQAFHFKNTCEMLEDRKAKFQTEVDDLADKTKYDSDSSKDFQMLGYFMDITGILLSATSDTAAYDSYAKTMQDLQASANNITILEQVAETAKVNGNKNLENAAYQLIGNIQSQTMSKLGSVIDLAEAFTKSAATSSLEWFINQSAQGWAEADGGGLSILDTIALVAQGVNAVLGWGPVYDEAQILMTLNKMDGNMNIVNTLKNDDAPYMLELWGLLQAKGCDSAQDFLDKWKAANFLDCEELGIEKNGIPAVNKALEEDRDYYIEELNLPLEKSK